MRRNLRRLLVLAYLAILYICYLTYNSITDIEAMKNAASFPLLPGVIMYIILLFQDRYLRSYYRRWGCDIPSQDDVDGDEFP